MPDVFATSFAVREYSGMLFNKGNTKTPLSAIIGGRAKVTDHVEFVTGQEYATEGGSQPNISEAASLTAPYATVVTREQKTNVTQIYQESVGISYGKMSNMGTLSGVNIANQVGNPVSEIDFQVAAKMAKINADIEYTFINGVYNKATNDSEVNKTRGLISAITTNVIDMGGKALGLWGIADLVKLVYEANAPINDLVLWCDATTMYQIHADAAANGLTIVPAARDVNGIYLQRVLTPLGDVYLYLGAYLPAGTALLLDLNVIAPVLQPVPGKGNFFLEELAKTGAGSKFQLFGQIGLDHGPEWYHGKLTNLSTEFEAPKGKNVYVAGGAVGTVEQVATPVEAVLDKTEIAADNAATVSVTNIVYDPAKPASAPSVAYLWQIRDVEGTTWVDLTGSYTGYNTATLTAKAVDAGKHYRCKVTISGSAIGTLYTAECNVAGE